MSVTIKCKNCKTLVEVCMTQEELDKLNKALLEQDSRLGVVCQPCFIDQIDGNING